jgi:hypothetical protein
MVVIKSKLAIVRNKLAMTGSEKQKACNGDFLTCVIGPIAFQSDILHKSNFILNCLNFRILYSSRHLDALLVINVYKSKMNVLSITDIVGIRVPTEQITETSAGPPIC